MKSKIQLFNYLNVKFGATEELHGEKDRDSAFQSEDRLESE